MNNVPQRQILVNYLLDTCTPAEQREVERWLEQDAENALTLQKEAKKLRGDKPLPIIEKEQVMSSISQEIDGDSTYKRKYKNKRQHPYRFNKQLWTRAAAMLLIVLTVGVGAFYFGRNYMQNKNQPSELQVVQLPYGRKATLHFGDGSVIKLNGGSTLKYPKTFDESKRVVYLEGEAFFSIAHDASRPFIIHTGHKIIRDLGTAFNVEAYEGQKLQVAVTEGVVSVTPAEVQSSSDSQSIILTQNQWASFKQGGDFFKRGEGNIWPKIAWKNGILVFDNKSFAEAAAMLERWYGVKIILEDSALKDVILKGQHERVSLEDVLESIDFITGIEYTIENGVITIADDATEGAL